MNQFDEEFKATMDTMVVNKNKAIMEQHFTEITADPNDAILESHFDELVEATLSKNEVAPKKITKNEFKKLASNGVVFRGEGDMTPDRVAQLLAGSKKLENPSFDKVDIKSNRMIRHAKSGSKPETRFETGDEYYRFGNDHIAIVGKEKNRTSSTVYMIKASDLN